MAKNNPRENRARQKRALSQIPGEASSAEKSEAIDSLSQEIGDAGSLHASESSPVGQPPATRFISSSISIVEGSEDSASPEMDPDANPATTSGRTRGERPSVRSKKVVKPAKQESDGEASGPIGSDDGCATLDVQHEEDVEAALDSLGPSSEELHEAGGGSATAQESPFVPSGKHEDDKQKRATRRRKIAKRILIAILLLLFAAAIAIVAAFCVFRWNYFDDAHDIQGVWAIDGSDSTIEITDSTIALTDDIAYKYVLDPDSKVIRFSFGNLTGEGHYRFSLDRNELSIIDGETTWNDSLMNDLQWTKDALIEYVGKGSILSPGAGEDTTTLKRT